MGLIMRGILVSTLALEKGFNEKLGFDFIVFLIFSSILKIILIRGQNHRFCSIEVKQLNF